jgi:hypothetical protein
MSIFFIFIISCNLETTNVGTADFVQCPENIAQKALQYAVEYAQSDTEYQLGGQDLLRTIKIDCSGLVVNCYKYAVMDTDYSLLFQDAAVIDFYSKWTIKTENPRPGDIIFMGNSDVPDHMSFFVKEENGSIYFIDSTLKENESINGVSERNYPSNDARFISFGVMKLNYL